MMVNNLKYTCAFMLVLFVLAVSGCSPQQEAQKAMGETQKETEAQNPANSSVNSKEGGTSTGKIVINVYFSNEDATKLLSEQREINADDKYTEAVKELLSGPMEAKKVALLPKATKLNGVTVKNAIAYVNLSAGLVDHFNGGSGSEILLVASIVNTLTEFPEIEKVQILVDGQELDTISGHMDTSEPFARMDHIL